MSAFNFKRFQVVQGRSAMKVNTDGVLLGAWMNITLDNHRMLDIGTGSGVIALMAAQRAAQIGNAAEIVAIDIDADSLDDARENFEKASFSSSSSGPIVLEAKHLSLQDMASSQQGGKFDLIFSNPPYFINSLKASETSRSNARHTDTLGQGELIKGVMELLEPQGRLALVLPATEGEQLLSKISFIAQSNLCKGDYSLQLLRLCKVHTTIKKPAKRWLMEFIFSNLPQTVDQSQLIMTSDGDFTTEYKSLTADFYLNF